MGFNFQYDADPILQALAAYQAGRSNQQHAVQGQERQLQYQQNAQFANQIGGGLGQGIQQGLQIGLVNPILQKQQLQYAQQYSQQVTIPQMQAHYAAATQAQQLEHLSNAFGPGVTPQTVTDNGRQQYQAAMANLQNMTQQASLTGDISPIHAAVMQYSQQFGVPAAQLTAPETMQDNALMSRIGFQSMHNAAVGQQVQQHIQQQAAIQSQQQQARRAEEIQQGVAEGKLIPNAAIDPQFAKAWGGLQQQMRAIDTDPQFQGNPQMADQARQQLQQRINAAALSAPPGFFAPKPATTPKEMVEQGLIYTDPATGNTYAPHGVTVHKNDPLPTPDEQARLALPAAQNFDQAMDSGHFRTNKNTLYWKPGAPFAIHTNEKGSPLPFKVEPSEQMPPDGTPIATSVAEAENGLWWGTGKILRDETGQRWINEGGGNKRVIKPMGTGGITDQARINLRERIERNRSYVDMVTGKKIPPGKDEVDRIMRDEYHVNPEAAKDGHGGTHLGGGTTGGSVVEKMRQFKAANPDPSKWTPAQVSEWNQMKAQYAP